MSNKLKTTFLDRMEKTESKIAIVGLGYVGLPLIKRLIEVGFSTIGLDIDAAKINALKAGKKYIKHIEVDDIHESINLGDCLVTEDFSNARGADVIVLCVPTPLGKFQEPDLSYVIGSLQTLLPHLTQGQLLVLESTTYPGTTEEEIVPRIEGAGFTVGEDFFVAYSPEREDPGNPDFGTHTIPKVCGGVSENCLETSLAFYNRIIGKVVPVSAPRVAELTKILENTYRAVNIGLVNELKIIADKMGIDIFEVIEAAKTKPFGYTAFYPGPGLGGHCIPIDPFYLTWKAREFGVHTRFIELAGDINRGMPEYLISKVMEGLNKLGKPLQGSNVLVLGLAYKKNIDDFRESPSIEILERLIDGGASTYYADPHIPTYTMPGGQVLNSASLGENDIEKYDAVIVATNHDDFDWELLGEKAKLIIDCRGVYSTEQTNVVRA